MKIDFKTLKLNNFLSFHDAEIQLDNNGYVVVSGHNNYKPDNATSNGSGKSSIWDAISWCLTGQTIRGVKDVVNNSAKKDGCVVELLFSVDGTEYRIIRSKDHFLLKTNMKIYVNGEEKSGKGIRESEKILADYLPDLTASFIGSVIILGQGMPERFTNNTPSGRKDILESLSHSDFMIEEIKNSLSKRETELKNKLRAKEDEGLEITTKTDCATSLLQDVKVKLDNYGNEDDFVNQVHEIQGKIDIQKEEVKEVTRNKKQMYEALQEMQQEFSSLTATFTQKLSDIDAEYSQKITEKTSHVSQLQTQCQMLHREIDRLKAIKDICPTCGQKLPGVEKPSTEAQEIQLQELLGSYNNAKSSLDALKKEHEEKRQAILHNRDAATASLQQRMNQVSKDLRAQEEVSVRLTNELNSLIESMHRVQGKIDTFVSERNKLEKQREDYEKQIENLRTAFLYNDTERNLISRHLEIINKMSTIANRDFRGYLLSNIIQFIDTKAKEYSEDIFETTNLDITLEGNNIEIRYNGKPYGSLSGGERQKVDIIVQLSIRDMLSKFMGYSCNILVLDEIFDNLDSYGCDKVINMFAKKLKDVRSIFIISHHADSLSIPYDKEIVVVKNEMGYSEIL